MRSKIGETHGVSLLWSLDLSLCIIDRTPTWSPGSCRRSPRRTAANLVFLGLWAIICLYGIFPMWWSGGWRHLTVLVCCGPVSLRKIAPLKNHWGAIFSQTTIVKHSPLGDLFTIAVCEKSPLCNLFTIPVCEIIASYCLIVRNSPPRRTTETFWTGAMFSRGD